LDPHQWHGVCAGVWHNVKILQVHNTYRQGGGEDSVVRSEAALLRAAGHEVIEHQSANPPSRLGAAAALTVSSWNPLSARELAEVVDRTKPDVAHVHNTWYRLSPSILRLLHRRGIPVVMTVHNYRLMCANALLYRNGSACTDCVGTHPWRGAVRRCYRDSLVASAAVAGSIAIHRALGTWTTYVDQFVVATDFLRAMLVEAGLSADKIRRIPLSATDPGQRLRPPSASRTVLFVGRLDAEKGTRDLMDLWRGLDHGLELRIIGDGAERAALEALRAPNVRFEGWMKTDDVRREMMEARSLVFPSVLIETFGLSMVEAFAAGIPVVANGIGTRPEVVGRDGAGWLVRGRDQWLSALANLGDDTLVDRAGRIARQRYQERFDPAVTLPQLLAVYDELLSAPRPF
jgi:glycosyltransferase involved in cell wall biosynthesis